MADHKFNEVEMLLPFSVSIKKSRSECLYYGACSSTAQYMLSPDVLLTSAAKKPSQFAGSAKWQKIIRIQLAD